MIYIIYPYRNVSHWFCEWSSENQPKLFRHMCFGLAYKKDGEIHAVHIHGKAIIYIDGAVNCTVFPKFKPHPSILSWVKSAFK